MMTEMGVLEGQILEAKCEAKLELMAMGVQTKKTSVGGVWIYFVELHNHTVKFYKQWYSNEEP